MEIDYVKLYREADDIDSFVRLVKEAGGDPDEAVTLYFELNFKYESQ